MQPAFSGMLSRTSVRKTYSTAARTIADGQLKLPALAGDVPVKSIVARRRSAAIATARRMYSPPSSSTTKLPSRSRAMAERTQAAALFCTCPM
jgi:hypothetical protein